MKLLQESERKLSSIRLPGGWDKRLDEKKVAAMRATIAEAVRQHGRDEAPKHLPWGPVVIDQGDRLVYGRHRIKASMLSSLASVRTAKYQFSGPREAEITELRENLDRRVLSPEDEARATARLVELLKEVVAEERAVESANELPIQEPASKPGKKRSVEGEAIDRAAAETGMTRQGVKARIEKANGKDAPAPAGPTIDCWDLRTDDPAFMVTLDEAAKAQKALDTVSAACSRAIAALSEAFPNTALWPAIGNLKEHLHTSGRVARALRPVAICPFCKDVVDGCPTCQGRGVVGQGEVERAPNELTLSGDLAMVCIGPGQIVPLREGRGRSYGKARGVHAPKEKSAKGKVTTNGGTKHKRVKVTDQEGNVLAEGEEPPPSVDPGRGEVSGPDGDEADIPF